MLKTHSKAVVAALAVAAFSCKSGPNAGAGPASPLTNSADPATGSVVASPEAPPPGAPKEVTSVEGITEYSLDNGMRVLLFPDQSKDQVTVNVTYLVGSRHEGYGETGMAHLLEHMLFKGTPKHPKVWEELETRGAANNASTWYDRTNYFETVPSSDENLAWALEMEADRMVNANVSDADLKSEFTVVRNEFEMGENDPSSILSERMWSTAYLWHNYGKSTIGSRADIEKVPASRLKAFYRKYYRPDNATLVVAGKFDPAKALTMVNSTFGVLTRPSEPLAATYTVEPAQDGDREVTLRRNGDVAVIGLVYHVGAGVDADFPAVQAIADALTSEPSGRLYQALVKTGLATTVQASVLPLHDPGLIEIAATVSANKPLAPVRESFISIVEGLAKNPVTDAEVKRFQAKKKKQFKLSFANSRSLATNLSEWMAMGDWRLLFVNRDGVEKLTAAQVNTTAARYFLSANRTLGTFVPTKTPERPPLVERPDITPMVATYKGRNGASEGEKFDATVANIEKRTQRVTLPVGLKIAMLPKETRGDTVRARLTIRYGTEKDLAGQALAASYLGDIMERGTKKHDFQGLKDEWDRLEAQVSFGSTAGALVVNMTTVRDNLPEVLALVDEVLRQPSFPADQFAISVKESLTALEAQRQDPQAQAFTSYQRQLNPYPKTHPLYVASTDEEIAETKGLKLAAVKKLYGSLGMSNATLALVGDFDPAVIKPWVEKTWGTWKTPRPYQRVESKFFATKPGEMTVDTPDKENALIVAGYEVKMRDDHADYPAMVVANYVLGGGGFASRMMIRLRQKDGLSYGSFSFFNPSPLDEVGLLGAGAILAPQNAAKGMAALIEEFQKLITGGVPDAELAAAKESIAKDFSRNLAEDPFILGQLEQGLFIGRTLEFQAKQQDAIKALTAAQVNETIKKYVSDAALYKVTGGDKKKMGGK